MTHTMSIDSSLMMFLTAIVALWVVLTVVCDVARAADAPVDGRIVLSDYTDRGFQPDLVQYTLNIEPGKMAALRLADGQGRPVPIQVVTAGKQGSNRISTLSFVTGLEAGGRGDFSLRNEGKGEAPASLVRVEQSVEGIVLANSLLAVRVSAASAQTFAQPVEASTLPAPILAFRGPGDPAWRDGSLLLKPRKVKAFRCTITAQGPVIAEVTIEYDLDNGG